MKARHLSSLLSSIILTSLLLVTCSPSPPLESQISFSQVSESSRAFHSPVPSEYLVIPETIEESLLFEQEGIYIRSRALDFSNPEGPVLFYEVENQSEGAIAFFFYGVSVNGIMIWPRFSPWEGPEEVNPYF